MKKGNNERQIPNSKSGSMKEGLALPTSSFLSYFFLFLWLMKWNSISENEFLHPARANTHSSATDASDSPGPAYSLPISKIAFSYWITKDQVFLIYVWVGSLPPARLISRFSKFFDLENKGSTERREAKSTQKFSRFSHSSQLLRSA